MALLLSHTIFTGMVELWNFNRRLAIIAIAVCPCSSPLEEDRRGP